MGSLPILLKPDRILLIGAGNVGLQKARVLAENDLVVTVISETFNPAFYSLPHLLLGQRVCARDLAGYDVVIDATGCPEVADMLKQEKTRRGFLLNVVDVPESCDFYFASLLQRGPIKVAVSSEGYSPTMTQCIRERIAQVLPESLGELALQKGRERREGRIDPAATRRQTQALLGKVFLVGCGIGDVELLTLKAYRAIKEADVVLYDHLISDAILELIPEHSERAYVGKRKGHHSMTQEAINTLLEDYAKQGKHVARLKSGDPYIFGRGAEEALHLGSLGIEVEVIAGISSAIAGPASAGIPPTARGYATNFSIVSAHLKDSKVNLHWLPLLRLPSHTTVVLMGLSLAGHIADAAIAGGVDPSLPAAIIANASRPDQQTVVTTVAGLGEAATQVNGPAVIVLGEVVKLHGKLPGSEKSCIRDDLRADIQGILSLHGVDWGEETPGLSEKIAV